MAIATGFVKLNYGEEKQATTTRAHRLGTKAVMTDGREFVYARAGSSTALLVGQVQAAGAVIANHDSDLAVQAAAAAGATQVALTLGSTAATVDQYAEGYLYFNDEGSGSGEGEGFSYKIKPANEVAGNAHQAADSAGTITVNLDEPLIEAITTGNSQAGLMTHPAGAVVVAPTTVAGVPIGVSRNGVAASSYCWLQTYGLCPVLTDGTIVLGNEVMVSDGTAGSVEAQNYGGTVELQTVGVSHGVIAASGEYSMIFLRM